MHRQPVDGAQYECVSDVFDVFGYDLASVASLRSTTAAEIKVPITVRI